MKKISWILASFIMVLTMWVNIANAAGNPVNVLESIANQMIEKLKANQATIQSNPSLVYTYANQLIVPHADLDEMSKRVLPPQVWASATPQQRAQFKKEFTKLLVHTYAGALAEYKDQTVNFSPVRGGFEGKAMVNVNSTIVRSDGPSIQVNYSMVMRGSQWKVFDMVVEGVSMLESFRSQFADQLSQGNMQSLIETLAQHNGA